MPDLSTSPLSAARVAPKRPLWRLVALGVTALLLVYVGVSWRMGWFPFVGMRSGSMLDAVTAPGPSTLTPEELGALLKQTSAQGSSKLTPEEQAALVRATSAE